MSGGAEDRGLGEAATVVTEIRYLDDYLHDIPVGCKADGLGFSAGNGSIPGRSRLPGPDRLLSVYQYAVCREHPGESEIQWGRLRRQENRQAVTRGAVTTTVSPGGPYVGNPAERRFFHYRRIRQRINVLPLPFEDDTVVWNPISEIQHTAGYLGLGLFGPASGPKQGPGRR